MGLVVRVRFRIAVLVLRWANVRWANILLLSWEDEFRALCSHHKHAAYD